MTPDQAVIVRMSWEQVLPIQDTAAELFYNKLFELDPTVKSLFKGDMTEQGKRLMSMITIAVNALDRIETLMPAVQDLGRRHAGYGVQPSQYDTVATALLWTLGKGLGDRFTEDVRDSWIAVYKLLATTMQRGAGAGSVA